MISPRVGVFRVSLDSFCRKVSSLWSPLGLLEISLMSLSCVWSLCVDFAFPSVCCSSFQVHLASFLHHWASFGCLWESFGFLWLYLSFAGSSICCPFTYLWPFWSNSGVPWAPLGTVDRLLDDCKMDAGVCNFMQKPSVAAHPGFVDLLRCVMKFCQEPHFRMR